MLNSGVCRTPREGSNPSSKPPPSTTREAVKVVDASVDIGV